MREGSFPLAGFSPAPPYSGTRPVVLSCSSALFLCLLLAFSFSEVRKAGCPALCREKAEERAERGCRSSLLSALSPVGLLGQPFGTVGPSFLDGPPARLPALPIGESL